MFINSASSLRSLSAHGVIEKALKLDPDSIEDVQIKAKEMANQLEQGTTEISFNKTRLIVAAALLLIMLVFAIGTAFFQQLAQIHIMLVHAFELILGIIAGLLGGEVLAKR